MPTTTTSTVPAVYDAMLALFGDALPGVQVVDGRPPDTLLARELVFLGDYDLEAEVPVSKAGRKARDERYTIDVVIFVARPRGTTSQARARAEEIRSTCESALAADVILGDLPGLLHATWQGGRGEAGQSNEGPYCVVTARVRVVARLD